MLCVPRSEALPVHSARPKLVILGLAQPQLLERGQTGQNRPANPHGVLALWWRDDVDAHAAWHAGFQLPRHARGNALEHGRSSTEHHVFVQRLADVVVTLAHAVERSIVQSWGVAFDQAGVEQRFRGLDAFCGHTDSAAVWQLKLALARATFLHLRNLLVEVRRNVAQLLLDVLDDICLRGSRERVSASTNTDTQTHSHVRKARPSTARP